MSFKNPQNETIFLETDYPARGLQVLISLIFILMSLPLDMNVLLQYITNCLTSTLGNLYYVIMNIDLSLSLS